MFVVFLVSGLMHEYVYSILFHQNENIAPIYGKNLMFFLWNGAVIYVENQIGHWFVFQWMKLNLPCCVCTFLVIMISIPVSHWFSGDWIVSGYFFDVSIGIPIFVLS